MHDQDWGTAKVVPFSLMEHAKGAIILAIDLGKFNRILCHFDSENCEASFRTVKTTPADCGSNSFGIHWRRWLTQRVPPEFLPTAPWKA